MLGMLSKRAAEVFLPKGCVRSISLPMPIGFGLLVALTETSCSQLPIAVVRGQPFLSLKGHDLRVFVKLVLKFTLFQSGPFRLLSLLMMLLRS